MSYMSAGVEYGLHCLLYLVPSDDMTKEASVRDLAELQGVPGEFLAKVFTKLAKAGLVTATEGIKGGFRLSKSPKDISIFDVVTAIDGEKKIFNCKEIRSNCSLFTGGVPDWATAKVCSIHGLMLEAEEAMKDVLKKRNLYDLSLKVSEKYSLNHKNNIIQWFSDKAESRK